MDYNERKTIQWMQWALDKQDPFVYFENKYGKKPTKIILGTIKIPFSIPEGVEVVQQKFELVNQIMLA